MHHFASDGVDSAGGEASLLLALAARKKQGHDKEKSEWSCGTHPSTPPTLERRKLICGSALNGHGTLGGFFLRRLQEVEGFAEDWIFGRERTGRNRFFLRIGSAAVIIAGVVVGGGGTHDL